MCNMKSWFLIHVLVIVGNIFDFSDCEKNSTLTGKPNAVCQKIYTETIYKEVPYTESYESGRFFKTTLYRINYRREPTVVYKLKDVCCQGYFERNGECLPICEPPCVFGECHGPNMCICNYGYIKDNNSTNHNVCVPVCDNKCIRGTCTQPFICTCDEGYELDYDGFTCNPVCNDCHYDEYCSGPNECSCNDGYIKQYYFTHENESSSIHTMCEPRCDKPCVNGYCIKPNICQCNEGFTLAENNIFYCEPICREVCNFGTCTAPDTCTCFDGYEISQIHGQNFCKPICYPPCQNGYCSFPNLCTCHDGYINRYEAGDCIPACNKQCYFGTCTAPDVCTCNEGYRLLDNSTNICKPVCSQPCINGKCTSPDTCSCLDGYYLSFNSKYICDPICFEPCVNGGYCLAPEICSCGENYTMDENYYRCNFVCNCTNGFCAEPDSTCHCHEGYAFYDNMPENYCGPICDNCVNAECIEPQTCQCYNDHDEVIDENGNVTCINPCKSCKYGDCVDKKCKCYYGWEGEDCDEAILCKINHDFINDEGINQSRQLKDVINNTTKDFLQHILFLPDCSGSCISEINSTSECYLFTPNITLKPNKRILCFLNTGVVCPHTWNSILFFAGVSSLSVLFIIIILILIIYTKCSILNFWKYKRTISFETNITDL